VERQQHERSDARDGRRRGPGERRERGERESHLGYPKIPRAITLPDRMDILVRYRRRHREIPKRGRHETNRIERPEPCPRERCCERQPAVELQIQHPTETRRTAPTPARKRAVYPIGQRRTGEREGPRELRRIASPIAGPGDRRRGDDRSPKPSAQGNRVDGIEIVGLAIFAARESSRDEELLDQERSQGNSHEPRAATALISREQDGRAEDRDDPDAGDTNPSCAHAYA